MPVNVVAKTWKLPVGGDSKWRSKPPIDNLPPTVPTNPLAQAVSSALLRVSWTASTDSQSGVAYYIVERSANGTTGWTQVGTPATTSYDDGSVSSGTTYYYRVKSVDGSPAANVSAASSIANATTPAGAALQWAQLDPPYLSVIPGIAGFGTDTPGGSGRHLTTPATTVCVVNTTSNDRTLGTLFQSSPRVYKCSLGYAMQMTGPRVVVFETSGVNDMQRTQNAASPYMSMWGQTAPGGGFFIKNGSIRLNGGEQVMMHMQNYQGDEASAQDAGARRNLSMGIGGTSRYVAAWCSMFWSSDQAVDCSVGGSNFTIVHCLLAEALCDSIHPKGVHGYAALFENGCDRVSFYRNAIAHFIERDPLTRSPHAFIANNLIYNSKGQTVVPIGGYGMNPESYQGVVTRTCIERNLLIKGPNFSSTYGGTKPIWLQGAVSGSLNTYALIAGCKIYLEGNRAVDFGTITSQNDLWQSGGTLPSGLISATRLADCVPDGMVLEDPDNPGFAQLMASTVGARPGLRTVGRETTVVTHWLNKLAGTGDLGTGLNTPPSGPITCPVVTRDLFNSTAMGGDPMPNGSDRDTVQPSGYTKLEEWGERWNKRVRGLL